MNKHQYKKSRKRDPLAELIFGIVISVIYARPTHFNHNILIALLRDRLIFDSVK